MVKTREAESFGADRPCCVFQVSADEPSAAAGPGSAAGLRAERRAVRGPGLSTGADRVGRPRGGVLQVFNSTSFRTNNINRVNFKHAAHFHLTVVLMLSTLQRLN